MGAMSDLSALNLRPGEVVGGYTLISRLGSGAMGSVWRVHDDGGQVYAMKILRDSLSDEASGDGADPGVRTPQDPNLKENVTARERLRREAMALKRVDHPGVCGIVDMELDDAVAFIVTELIEGKNLKDDVAANGKYVGDDLERLARKLIDAVRAVHAAGIIHRDIKPTNVMVSASGPVLVDFGIAMGEGESHVTRTGLVMGTPGFIAPEIIDGAESSEATDWWSVASVLAFAATGEPVFGTKPMMAVLEREASGNANLAGLPVHTLTAFRSALNPDPAKRCTPDQLLHAIALDALIPFAALDDDTLDSTLPHTTGDATEVMRPFDGDATAVLSDAPSGLSGTAALPGTRMMPATAATAVMPPAASARAAWRDGDDWDAVTDATRALRPDQCTVALASDPLDADDATAMLADDGVPDVPAVLPSRTRVMPAMRHGWDIPDGSGRTTDESRRRLRRLAGTSDDDGTAAAEEPEETDGPEEMPPAYVPYRPQQETASDGGVGSATAALPPQTPATDARPGVAPVTGTVPAFLREPATQATAVMPPTGNGAPATMPVTPMRPMPMQSAPMPVSGFPQPPRMGPQMGPTAPNPAVEARIRYLQRGKAPLFAFTVVPAVAAVITPTAGVVAAAVIFWVLLTIGCSADAQLTREERRGGERRGSDAAMRAVQMPWHLLKALAMAVARTLLFLLVDVAGMTALVLVFQLPVTPTPTPGGIWPYQVPWPVEGPLSATGAALAFMAAAAWLVAAFWPYTATLRLGAGVTRGNPPVA
ncbi:serine/threonine-protein kinase [Bifidobacterium saguinibicoloris]|uniref:serine/threonine-protein kinase n=1 Tax=Bifidobacterium saguinibicoloris TaxID=2834433 RepID=UPI001F2A40FA|nr:serine/threonine-protein kinase [Bifidobacterium saguinibicoloris]